MKFLNTLPRFSLTLLLITSATFGWLLPIADSFWDWLLPIALVVLITLTLIVPVKNFTQCLASLLKSDLRAFITVILTAFAVVIIMRWIVTASRILTLLTAGALARLDMQTAGYTQMQAFWMLIGTSITGLSLGTIAHIVFLANIHA